MKLSIITVTRNSAATVADCIASIRQQTYPDIEHLIIDGASTDDTLEIVQDLTDKVQGSRFKVESLPSPVIGSVLPFTLHPSPFTIVISEPDDGIYDAMNKGIARATGDVIGILNGDDFYVDSQVLARVAAVFEDPAVMSCYGDLVYVKEAGAGLRARGTGITPAPFTFHLSPFTIHRFWSAGTFDHTRFAWGWMPPHPTFFVRRSVYEQYGTFRRDMGSAADYELMLRFLLKERITTAYIPSVMVAMRPGGASNASLKNRLRANRMDRRAWTVNGLTPFPWTIICKPLRKLSQWLVRGKH
jgi:glycosyltransferase involved in cell wall biosynthesis